MKHSNKFIIALLFPLLTSCSFDFLTYFGFRKAEKPEIDIANLGAIRLNISDAYSLGVGTKSKAKTRQPENPLPIEFLKQKVASYTGVVPSLQTSIVDVSQTIDTFKTNTYTFSALAKRKENDLNKIEEIIFGDDQILIKSDSKHSYRIINKEFNEDSGWIRGENGKYITFKVCDAGKEHIEEYKTYVRSEDAIITIDDSEHLKYSITDKDGNIISKLFKDNDSIDVNREEGQITIEGLTENETYQIQKTGHITENEIDTSNLDFGVEHCYVYNSEYTFVTFVKNGKSGRGEGPVPYEYPLTDITGVDYREEAVYAGYRSDDYFYILENFTGRLYPFEANARIHIENRIITYDDKIVDFKLEGDKPTFVDTGYRIKINEYRWPERTAGIQDKYGNRLLFGDNYLGLRDTEKKFINVEPNYYHYYSTEGEIFRQKKGDRYSINPLEKLTENLEFVPLTEKDNASSLREAIFDDDFYYYEYCFPTQIINGRTTYSPKSWEHTLPITDGDINSVKPNYLYAEIDCGETTPSVLCRMDMSDEEKETYFFNFNAFGRYDVLLCATHDTVYQLKDVKKYLHNGGSPKITDILNDTETIEIDAFSYVYIEGHNPIHMYNSNGELVEVRPMLIVNGDEAYYEMAEKDSWGRVLSTTVFQPIN